ncbi:MAG: hypothetical protein ABSH47_20470 [Bryobacteraceae bacterium]|jgi:hypothetical protein
MARVECPACQIYEIAEDALAAVKAGEVRNNRLPFVAAAGLRRSKAGRLLRIECLQELLAFAADELARQRSGDIA